MRNTFILVPVLSMLSSCAPSVPLGQASPPLVVPRPASSHAASRAITAPPPANAPTPGAAPTSGAAPTPATAPAASTETSSDAGASAALCTACFGETSPAELPSETASTPAPSPKPKNLEDAWIGLSAAEVTRAASRDRGGWGPNDVSYSGGPPRVKRRGDIWTLEWIPGGCSDFSAALTLHFVHGRVKRVELDRHHRHTGMECALGE